MSLSPRRIVFLDSDTMADSVSLPAFSFPHELQKFAHSTPDQVIERIQDAHIVISNKVAIGATELAAAKHLSLIAIAATGSDNIDLAACKARQVAVCNIRDYASRSVPEHVFGLIFALRRNLFAYRQSVQAGRWQEAGQFCYFDYPIADLAGSCLGIIGSGSLGSAVAKMGQALGMRTVFAGRKGQTPQAGSQKVEFDQVLQEADFISLHCPLTEETNKLFSEREFNLMRPGKTFLINTARGGLVDNHALEKALRTGQLAGAGIDVCTPEPPPADHRLMGLLDLPNFILTPHVAWASQEAMQSLANQLADNIEAHVAGRAQNLL